MLSPRKAVQSMVSYHPPLAGRNGLRLDFNENTDGCSPRVLECLKQLPVEQLAKYPEREPVEAQIAEFLKVTPRETLLTNGVDEGIHLLCQTYIEPGDEVLIVVPTYSMYRIYAMASGAKVVSIPPDPDFQFPHQAVLNRITPRTRLIAIANPNNPTGAVASQDALREIARFAAGAAVLVDEAYFEFYGETMLHAIREFGNLFVARTFSKAYGLAGLRIGVLVANAEQMRAIRRVSSPYNVNALALACLPEALADQQYLQEYVSSVLASRARLEQFLACNGICFWPSHANFVLIRVGHSASDAARFVEEMRRQGILVRDRSSDHGCGGCVRVTVGPKEHCDRLLTALEHSIDELEISQRVSRR
jgi:histidinol-phosphate aminotransferase